MRIGSLLMVRKSYVAQQTIHLCHRMFDCKLIDGNDLAQKYREQLKTEITSWINEGNTAPHLSVIMRQCHAASESYIKMKCKAAEHVGIATEVYKISETISQVELLKMIENLNQNPNTDAILVQLPLSTQISLEEVCCAISPEKDVDGFTPDSLGNLCLNKPNFVPCTALAVHHIISSLGVSMTGKNAVICSRSKHVGLPLSLILHSSVKLGDWDEGLNMSTTICHRHTPEGQLIEFTKNADVLITAVGQPNLIKGNMVKPGAVVIDVGFTEIREGDKRRVLGDVDASDVQKVAGVLSPVPGGVGPMTVAMLMSNTFLAAKQRRSKKNG